MKLLTPEKENEVFDIFKEGFRGDLNELGYQEIALTVFDRWLTEEEAKEKLAMPLFPKYQEKMFSFYNYIFRNCNVYSYFESLARSPGCVISFNNEEEYLDHINLALIERNFFRLIIPKYRIVIDASWDFTHFVYYPEEPLSPDFVKLVKEQGLYLLD